MVGATSTITTRQVMTISSAMHAPWAEREQLRIWGAGEAERSRGECRGVALRGWGSEGAVGMLKGARRQGVGLCRGVALPVAIISRQP